MSVQQQKFDSDLAEELEQLEYYSHGDHVEIEIACVQRLEDNEVRVLFDPPAGDDFTREMAVPIDPATDTEFTKLLHETGYNFGNAAEMVGDRVAAKYTDDGWEIQYTEPKIPVRDRLKPNGLSEAFRDMSFACAMIGALIYWPVSGPFVLLLGNADQDDEEHKLSSGGLFGIYVGGFVVWLVFMIILTSLAHWAGFQFPIEVMI